MLEPDMPASPLEKGNAAAPPDLGYLLRLAAGVHRVKIDRALADIGATAPQFLILTLIEANPGCSNADLARMAMLTTPTVSVIVTNLLQAKAISRRAHVTHGRIHHLDLTDAGRQLWLACKARAAVVEAELQGALGATQTAAIRSWLVHATGV